MTSIKKRKRGRPKKIKDTTKPPKKGKKKTQKSKKYSLLDNLKQQPQKITKSVLVHLPIDITKFQNDEIFFESDFLKYDQKIQDPLPYDPKNNTTNIYENIIIEEKEETTQKDKKDYNIYKKDEFINKKVKTILVQFNDFNKINKWPNSTDIKCWWCSYNFENPPCGIPIKYDNDIFSVYGCFCSFNCALSYNFNTNFDKKWERAGLIQLLYNKTFNSDDEIKYAPSRECLKDFGGYMTIEEFRNNTQNIQYTINYPPMLSIIPQIEEIRVIKETNRERDFQEKLNLVSEKMKIKNRIQNKKNLSMFLKKKVNKI